MAALQQDLLWAAVLGLHGRRCWVCRGAALELQRAVAATGVVAGVAGDKFRYNRRKTATCMEKSDRVVNFRTDPCFDGIRVY